MTIENDKITKAMRQEVMRAVVQATESVRNTALSLILNGQKTGRRYGRHIASAPGEAPASDTGHLVNSITTHYDEATLTGVVAVGANYGRHLEFGTQHMEPRPFLRPAIEANRERIEKALGASARLAIEGYKQR